MKLVVIGMPKTWPWGYVAICSASQLGEWWASGDNIELATGRLFTRTDQCGKNLAGVCKICLSRIVAPPQRSSPQAWFPPRLRRAERGSPVLVRMHTVLFCQWHLLSIGTETLALKLAPYHKFRVLLPKIWRGKLIGCLGGPRGWVQEGDVAPSVWSAKS
jgi:hypothetical protein